MQRRLPHITTSMTLPCKRDNGQHTARGGADSAQGRTIALHVCVLDAMRPARPCASSYQAMLRAHQPSGLLRTARLVYSDHGR